MTQRLTQLLTARAVCRKRLEKTGLSVDVATELRARLDLINLEMSSDQKASTKDDAAALDWLRSATPEQLVHAYRPDPIALQHKFMRLTVKRAQAVVHEIDSSADGLVLDDLTTMDVNEIDHLRFTARVTGPLLTELDVSGTVVEIPIDEPWWLTPPTVAGPVLPILLPVRMETRFERDGANWTLRLMIIPDEPWFANSQPDPSSLEILSFNKWSEALSAGLSMEDAWRHMADDVGPERAAWLDRSFGFGSSIPPSTPPEASTSGLDAQRMITEFPPSLQIFLDRGAGPTLAAETRIDVSALQITLPKDLDDPDEQQWWSNFEAATHVGLGLTILLGTQADDIDAIYVVGLSNNDSAGLFRDHRDAGRLGIIDIGTPTNSVSGERGAAPHLSAREWMRTVADTPCPSERDLSKLLTGDPNMLGALPGGGALRDQPGHSTRRSSNVLARVLWPALCGHALRDVWNTSDSFAEALADLSSEALYPEGPYSAIRIGDQPYGVVVASAPELWNPASTDRASLEMLVKLCSKMLPGFVASGESSGTAENASTEELFQLLGRPAVSSELRVQQLYPLTLAFFAIVLGGADLLDAFNELEARRDKLHDAVEGLLDIRPTDVTRQLVPLGETEILNIELTSAGDATVARHMADLIESVEGRDFFAFPARLSDELRLDDKPSLLIRLMIRSAQLSLAAIGRTMIEQDEGVSTPEPRDVTLEDLQISWDESAADSLDFDDPRLTSMQRWIRRTVDGASSNRKWEMTGLFLLVDALRAMKDVSPHEASRLLRGFIDCTSHRIDAVTAMPAIDRLQKMTAASLPIHRRLGAYGWVDAPRPRPDGTSPGERGFMFCPSDEHALTAAVLRDRSLEEPDRYTLSFEGEAIQNARRLAESVRQGIHPSEHLGAEVERVVEDRAQIDRLRTGFPIHASHKGRRVCNGLAVFDALRHRPASIDLPAASIEKLRTLSSTMDAYADLLLAEAVFRVVSGRGERAGAALDAASGLAPPPEFDILRGRQKGHTVTTSVAVVVTAGTEAVIPDSQSAQAEIAPASVFEPVLGDFLQPYIDIDLWKWQWQIERTDGSLEIVEINDLGLSIEDALVFTAAQLESMALARAGNDGGVVGRPGSIHHAQIARLLEAFANPLSPSLDHSNVDPAFATKRFSKVLTRRLKRSIQVLQALTNELVKAASRSDIDRLGELHGMAAKWGSIHSIDRSDVIASAARLIEEFSARLVAAADIESTDPTDLTKALRSLARPHGTVAFFAPTPARDLGALAEVSDEQEEDWLPVISAVQPAMARIDALRIDGMLRGSMHAARADNLWATKDNPNQSVVFTKVDLISPPASIGMVVVDRWIETIPESDHTASAALGFDAPRARAQQSILIAVPSDLSGDPNEQLMSTIAHVRSLTRARAALPESLNSVAGMTPTALLPALGPTGVRLNEAES